MAEGLLAPQVDDLADADVVAYSYKSRIEEGQGTNPEELIGAALAGCVSMSLSAVLTEGGTTPEAVHTDARVHLLPRGDGFEIARIELATQARVPGIERKEVGKFLQAAETAMERCPVSRGSPARRAPFMRRSSNPATAPPCMTT